MKELDDCPWIVMHSGDAPDNVMGNSMAYALECKRCGDIQRVAVPIRMELLLAMADKYHDLHKDCSRITLDPKNET